MPQKARAASGSVRTFSMRLATGSAKPGAASSRQNINKNAVRRDFTSSILHPFGDGFRFPVPGFLRFELETWNRKLETDCMRPKFQWRLRTRDLALGERTLVMGVLNVTPD